MNDGAAFLETLKRYDRDRYFACLLLPADQRDDITALYAFTAEISRIRHVVSEPLPGEIRLQWWRDSISSASLEARANPLANSLLDVIERHHLPVESFDKILLARAFDLYHDPLPTLSDFETYAGETTSLVFQLAARIAGVAQNSDLANAAGHSGVCYCLARTLAALAENTRYGQPFLPSDVLNGCDVDREKLTAGEMHDGLALAISRFVEIARDHEAKARAALGSLPTEARSVFALLAVVKPLLAKIEKNKLRLINEPVHLTQLATQWALWRGV